jgi:hypothetical protein
MAENLKFQKICHCMNAFLDTWTVLEIIILWSP